MSDVTQSARDVIRGLLSRGVHRCGIRDCDRPATLRVYRLNYFSEIFRCDDCGEGYRDEKVYQLKPVANADAIRMALVFLGEGE